MHGEYANVKARAAVLEEVGKISIREFEVPSIGPDEALLKVEMAGICGTDAKLYHGKLAAPLPLVLGHEILGTIAEIGEGAARRYGVRAGDRVIVEGSVPCWSCAYCLSGQFRFCQSKRAYGTGTPITVPPSLWGAMADYMYLAPGSAVHRIPSHIPARVAVLAKGVLANGVQWIRIKGEVALGATVVIQGAGAQGLAAVVIARDSGAGTIIVTGLRQDSERLSLARELGADHVLVAGEEDVVERVREITGGAMADLVLDVTGSPAAIESSVQVVRRLGTIVLGGLTGKETRTSLLLDHLVWNEVRVQGVFSKGSEAVMGAIRFIERKAGQYPLDRIISHIYPLEKAEEAIRAVAGDDSGIYPIKAALVP